MGSTLEARTREIGRDIFARAAAAQRGPGRWIDDQAMALSMRDERVKVQLFRFVDALPLLRTPAAVARHLREYLAEAGLHPALARWVKHIPDSGPLGALLDWSAHFGAQRLARRFIVGSDASETLAAIEDLRRQRLTFTIDLLGEAVLAESEAEHYQQQYLEFTEAITQRAAYWAPVEQIDVGHAGPIPRVNVSVKLSSLYSQFDPLDAEGTSRAVRQRLRPILRLARQRGAFVNLDMEQFAYKDLTLRIFREVLEEEEFRSWPDAGIAIQAYLRSCDDDLQSLYNWAARRGTPVSVRLVKGAYWDFECIRAAQEHWPVPVYTVKAHSDAAYERASAFLIERREVLRPAFASHNVRSIAHALALAEQHKAPPRLIEFQMLQGMADELKSALVGLGQRVRIYAPFGKLLPGMAYLVRRLLENTSNTSFIRAGFLEGVSMEKLLMNPLEIKPAPVSRPQARASQVEPPFRNEALSDFAVEANRTAMLAALAQTRGLFGKQYPAIVGNEPLPIAATLESLNPSHAKQLVGSSARCTEADALKAIEWAQRAYSTWSLQPAAARAKLLLDTAAVMRQRRFELAAWMVHESGKPIREADADVAEAIDFCEFYAREMLRLDAPRRRDVPGELNHLGYLPRGVAVIIAPWNFPLAILCGMTAAAVVAGNTAIMKPAEQSPVIAALLMDCFRAAGAPAGVVNYLPGAGEEIGPTLVRHPAVSIIAFTGSRNVGMLINRQAAASSDGDQIKKVIAELGGKNAIIVDDDADLDEACHGVAASAFGYAGQKCSACSRAIVLEPLYEAFLARLIEVTRSLRIGPAEDPGTFIGPVIDAEARDRILRTIAEAKQRHTLAFAGDLGALDEEGYYIPPHIFCDVPPDAALAQEEVFGPVLAVIRARDLDDALAIANSTRYALTGGLYSRSPVHIERIRREFRVGNLYINRKITGALVDRQPFGGFKLSGVGSKAGGPDYLQQFLLPRCITENTLRHGFAPDAGGLTA